MAKLVWIPTSVKKAPASTVLVALLWQVAKLVWVRPSVLIAPASMELAVLTSLVGKLVWVLPSVKMAPSATGEYAVLWAMEHCLGSWLVQRRSSDSSLEESFINVAETGLKISSTIRSAEQLAKDYCCKDKLKTGWYPWIDYLFLVWKFSLDSRWTNTLKMDTEKKCLMMRNRAADAQQLLYLSSVLNNVCSNLSNI